MRVLQVIPSLSLSQGGPSVALPIMERALANEGIYVETVTTNDDGPGRKASFEEGVAYFENGVVRRYFSKQSEFYKVSVPLSHWLSENVQRYDVLHVHAVFSYTSNAASRIARRMKVPYIIRPLGVLNQYGMKRRRAFLKKLSLRWIERPLLEDAAAIHFTSPQEQAEAETLDLAMRSIVVPLGIEAHERVGDKENETESVLFMSRIDPKKNIEGLLWAWALCHSDFPSWTLRIAGDGSEGYVGSLLKLVKELDIASSVEWLGRLEGAAKREALDEAAVFVLPSFSENFGIAAAEALFAGKACVLSPGVAVGVGAISAGAAVSGGPEPESIAESLRSLVLDKGRRCKLGAAGFAYAVIELSAETMGRRLREMYESILESP